MRGIAPGGGTFDADLGELVLHYGPEDPEAACGAACGDGWGGGTVRLTVLPPVAALMTAGRITVTTGSGQPDLTNVIVALSLPLLTRLSFRRVALLREAHVRRVAAALELTLSIELDRPSRCVDLSSVEVVYGPGATLTVRPFVVGLVSDAPECLYAGAVGDHQATATHAIPSPVGPLEDLEVKVLSRTGAPEGFTQVTATRVP